MSERRVVEVLDYYVAHECTAPGVIFSSIHPCVLDDGRVLAWCADCGWEREL